MLDGRAFLVRMQVLQQGFVVLVALLFIDAATGCGNAAEQQSIDAGLNLAGGIMLIGRAGRAYQQPMQ
jgi:hypothetical protein